MDRSIYLAILAMMICLTASLVDYGVLELFSVMNLSAGIKALLAYCLGGVAIAIAIVAETSTGLIPSQGGIRNLTSIGMTFYSGNFNKFVTLIVEFGALVFAAAQVDYALATTLNLFSPSLLFKFIIAFLAGTLGVFCTIFFAIAFDPIQVNVKFQA